VLLGKIASLFWQEKIGLVRTETALAVVLKKENPSQPLKKCA
jgi:hypothetical protein